MVELSLAALFGECVHAVTHTPARAAPALVAPSRSASAHVLRLIISRRCMHAARRWKRGSTLHHLMRRWYVLSAARGLCGAQQRAAVARVDKKKVTERRLSRSFRFGREIAAVANSLLRLKGETAPVLGAAGEARHA